MEPVTVWYWVLSFKGGSARTAVLLLGTTMLVLHRATKSTAWIRLEDGGTFSTTEAALAAAATHTNSLSRRGYNVVTEPAQFTVNLSSNPEQPDAEWQDAVCAAWAVHAEERGI